MVCATIPTRIVASTVAIYAQSMTICAMVDATTQGFTFATTDSWRTADRLELEYSSCRLRRIVFNVHNNTYVKYIYNALDNV